MCRQDPLNIPPEPTFSASPLLHCGNRQGNPFNQSPAPEQGAQTTTGQSCGQDLRQDQDAVIKRVCRKQPNFRVPKKLVYAHASPKARCIHQGDSRQACSENDSTCGSSGSNQGNSHDCFEDSNTKRPQEPASHQEDCLRYRQGCHEGQAGPRRLPEEADCQRCHRQDASNNHYWTSKELQIPEEESSQICPKGYPQVPNQMPETLLPQECQERNLQEAHQQGRSGTPSA
ncbi:hypothetical protein SNEBB_003641 [Seison nebaliae]|nr:hypothetical protein SNEBB_003641 [Seison nebaliae]